MLQAAIQMLSCILLWKRKINCNSNRRHETLLQTAINYVLPDYTDAFSFQNSL